MQTDHRSSKGHLSLIVRIIVALVAVGWVFFDKDLNRLVDILRSLNPLYFGVALGIYFAGQVVLAFRWRLLLHSQGIPLPPGPAIRLHLMGLFFNNMMPSSVGGDLVRAWYVAQHTDKKVESALSVFVDRIVGLLSILAMGLISYGFLMKDPLPQVPQASGETESSNNLFISLGIVGILVLLGVVAMLIPGIRKQIFNFSITLKHKSIEAANKVKLALLLYCKSPQTLIVALILTLALQSLTIIGFWLLGGNLGIEADLRHYFVIFPITWVVAALPISIAGAGFLEGGIVLLFASLASVPEELALALAICQRAIWVLSSLPGAVIHLIGGHLPESPSLVETPDSEV